MSNKYKSLDCNINKIKNKNLLLVKSSETYANGSKRL